MSDDRDDVVTQTGSRAPGTTGASGATTASAAPGAVGVSGDASDGVEAPAEPSEVEWRRLSPRMLAIHPIRAVRDLLPLLVGAMFATRNDDGPGVVFQLIIGVLVLVVAMLRWLTTRYRVTEGQVQLREGLLRRQTHTVPLDRVRTVDITAGPLQRVLGLAKAVIGSGAHAGGGLGSGGGLALDGLARADAEHLRVRLLHRQAASSTEPGSAATRFDAAPSDADTADRPDYPPADAADEVLVRLDPAWIRFGPLTLGALLSSFAVLALAAQGARMIGEDSALWDGVGSAYARMGLILALTVTVGAFLVATVVGGLLSYVTSYWGFQVARHGGSLRITRGLLTTRSTTLDTSRIRGVDLDEPLLLRLAGGATLDVIVAGLRTGESQAEGSDTLMPPAPVAAARALGARVRAEDVFAVPLIRHGARATRRRWWRAMQAAAIVTGICLMPRLWWDTPVWTFAPAVVAMLAVPLAHDRARALGHALTPRHLVTRHGSAFRSTTALELDGILGWDVSQTWFQRRAGLVTLTALTAAGSGGYVVLDVPEREAYRIIRDTERHVIGR